MKNITSNKNIFIVILIIAVVILSLILFRSKIFKTTKVTEEFDPNDKTVKLIISPEYDEYFVNQDVWIKVKVVNNSNENYYLKDPLTEGFSHFVGKYPSGRDMSTGRNFEPVGFIDSLKLEPGSSYEKVIPLNLVIERSFYFERKETGIYKIHARYQGIASNELDLNFTEPTGFDKELHDEAYVQLFSQKISNEEKTQKLGELLKKYPGTKYSPQLYDLFFQESRFSKDYNIRSEDINTFFENNYDTYGVNFILDIGNQNLEKLKAKYRGSKTEYMINQRKRQELTHK